MPLGGWISDRLTAILRSEIRPACCSHGWAEPGSLLLFAGTIVPGTAAAVLSLSLATGFASWCEGPFWASAIEVAGKQVGAACGILNTGGNVGGFLAPVLTPYIASGLDGPGVYTAGSAMAIVGVMACYFVDLTGQTNEFGKT